MNLLLEVSKWPGKYRRQQFWGSASYSSGISHLVSLSFTFLPAFPSLLLPSFGLLSCFWLSMLSLSHVEKLKSSNMRKKSRVRGVVFIICSPMEPGPVCNNEPYRSLYTFQMLT